MGSPELPSDAGEEDLRTTHIVHHPPAPSDDSDNESVNDYDGYQPLAMDEHHQGYVQNGFDDDDDEEEDATNNVDNNGGFNAMRSQQPTLAEDNAEMGEVTYGDPNLPPVESIDAEVEREVWSQPRPQELQIELDSNKTQQVSAKEKKDYWSVPEPSRVY